MSDARDYIQRRTRWVDDFPKEGIRFADLTPVFADADGLAAVTEAIATCVDTHNLGVIDTVAAVDARGFLLGGAAARQLGAGVLAVRKAGKLPPPVHTEQYALEYGHAALEIPAEGVDLRGHRVLIVDDVLATGGTLMATARLVEAAGGIVAGIAVVLELAGLGGRETLSNYPLTVLDTV
ncbi:MAG: adenine phosphoribosyltransferase [Rhodococcus sp.]|nr:adenine phosphoribosyltransferase [Rhodococcus sp. (in: high G+C Gram-positive bacteria)]